MKRRTDRRKKQQRRRKRRIRQVVVCIYRCVFVGAVVIALSFILNFAYTLVPRDREDLVKEGYPESLIALLERNPETKDFVLNYHKHRERNLEKNKELEIDLTEEVAEGRIPLFLQWDERWGYETYGSDFLAVTGCGPTCLAMVRCGLGGDTEWNPLKVANMAEEQGYYVEGSGSSWDLMTVGAAQLGLVANTVVFDAAHIITELENGRPIICIMRPGDFTATGHFIVLTGVDEEGRVTVCDPNSKINSEKSWDVDDLIPQIKNLWSYTL